MQALVDGPVAAPLARACGALGISRATVHRKRRPPKTADAARAATDRPRRRSPRALDPTERQRVIDALHSPELVDQTPREVYGRLLSMGIYLASVRTMYRVLASLGESTDRRRGHEHKRHPIPQLEAFAPNEVWTWDITKVPSFVNGVFFYLFVILDLFSRMVVGWMVAETENAELAGHLLRESIHRHRIEPGFLTVHSDRGSPMRAGSTTQLLAMLGVEHSFSRPRVSNDNPFVESSFKTAKYQPDYPGKFASVEHTRAYFAEYFDWYCEHHHHDGLALFTPADVFHGRVDDIAAVRQQALDAQCAAHPERFVRGRPIVPRPPSRVHINLPLVEPLPRAPRGAQQVALPAPDTNATPADGHAHAIPTTVPPTARSAPAPERRSHGPSTTVAATIGSASLSTTNLHPPSPPATASPPS